ncbi:hypothetical protein TgHK011_009143 [Trichoderma gracile]|nr:hypothetical protein TgHK011_009143 [Trichoderma gracile]
MSRVRGASGGRGAARRSRELRRVTGVKLHPRRQSRSSTSFRISAPFVLSTASALFSLEPHRQEASLTANNVQLICRLVR